MLDKSIITNLSISFLVETYKRKIYRINRYKRKLIKMSTIGKHINIKYPKCPDCKMNNNKDTYLKFYNGIVSSTFMKDWYYCPICKGLFLR